MGLAKIEPTLNKSVTIYSCNVRKKSSTFLYSYLSFLIIFEKSSIFIQKEEKKRRKALLRFLETYGKVRGKNEEKPCIAKVFWKICHLEKLCISSILLQNDEQIYRIGRYYLPQNGSKRCSQDVVLRFLKKHLECEMSEN